MRAGFGIVGLLVGVALLVYLFAQTQIPTAKVGKKAQDEVRQFSGRGPEGESAMESFAVEAKLKGAGIESLVVTSVTPGGAMESYYGLRAGDAVTAVGDLRLNDVANGDEVLAKGLVAEAFSKQQTLAVRRNGQPITLPLPPGAAANAATPAAPPAGQPPSADPAAAQAPATPAPAPKKSRGLSGQLEDIQNAAGRGGE